MLRSRVVPATGLTMARPPRAIRLNKVDLPTLARPTITTIGNPPAAVASIDAHWSGDFPDCAISEAQFTELAGVGRPAFLDFHPQLQEDVTAENLFDLEARARPDFLELAAAGADYHALV